MSNNYNRHPGTCPGWLAKLILGIALMIASTRTFPVDEDSMKGAYIYNIVKFVDWPQGAMNPDDNRFYVCVMGDERLNAFVNVLQEKTVGGRTILVTSLSSRDSGNCQVIFVSSSEAWRSQSALAELGTRPILTIGENDGFASRGGMIEFVRDNDHLGFKINNATAIRAHLNIRAQLMQLAKAVY